MDMVGGIYTYPSEKYESQLGWLFQTEWENIKCSKPPTTIYILQYCMLCIDDMIWYV